MSEREQFIYTIFGVIHLAATLFVSGDFKRCPVLVLSVFQLHAQ